VEAAAQQAMDAVKAAAGEPLTLPPPASDAVTRGRGVLFQHPRAPEPPCLPPFTTTAPGGGGEPVTHDAEWCHGWGYGAFEQPRSRLPLAHTRSQHATAAATRWGEFAPARILSDDLAAPGATTPPGSSWNSVRVQWLTRAAALNPAVASEGDVQGEGTISRWEAEVHERPAASRQPWAVVQALLMAACGVQPLYGESAAGDDATGSHIPLAAASESGGWATFAAMTRDERKPGIAPAVARLIIDGECAREWACECGDDCCE